jgi:RHS repeat-associated protein
MAVTAPPDNSVLANNQVMTPGQTRQSLDHRFNLAYQGDGNVVLYGPSGVMWATNTGGRASTAFVMQTDGNLVLYNAGTPIWTTGTNGGNSSYLAVQNDGNVVIYNSAGPRWATNTGGWGGISYGFSNLTGATLAHSTNIGGNAAMVSRDFGAASPQTNVPATNWGIRMTGKLYTPTVGSWGIRIWSDNGVRMWIDDKLVIDDWFDGPQRNHPTYVYNNATAESLHRVRIDYYHLNGGANLSIYMTPPGQAETQNVAQYLRPGYGLTTSTKIFDNQMGDVETKTSYGPRPELGLAQNSVEDSGGLSLTTSMAYEPYAQTNPDGSSSYLRQTAKYLPGATVGNLSTATQYLHYKPDDNIDNPCTTAIDPALQGGLAKGKIEPDPDGAGPQTPRVTETVYDTSGRTVATRYNNEPWTCTTYDSRGRSLTTIIPSRGQWQGGRTISNNYAVNGNPFVTGTTDDTGTIYVTTDLLGRTVSYTDAHGNTTTSSYDNAGHLTSRSGPLGNEEFAYDQYDRLVDQKLDGAIYAHITYDQYSRIDNVTYPTAGQQKVAYARDTLGRLNNLSYTVGASVPGPNLVANPSLEQTTGTPATPAQWTPNAWGNNTYSLTYENTGHTGSHSAKAEVTAFTDGDAKWYFDPVNVSGNTNYTFSDYYKSNAWSSVVAQYTNQDGSITYQYLGGKDASSSWAQATYSFTTPATVSKVSIFHVMDRVGWLQIDDADLHQTSLPVAATTISDSVNRSVTGDVLSGTENGLAKSYTYDKAGRLTNATVGTNTYAYDFSAPTSTQCPQASANLNANKNSNRTKMTVNGTTTTYCYDYADRLISSSDPSLNNPTYDTHGNIIEMGAANFRLRTPVDSSDRSRGIEQYDDNGNGMAVYYTRDAQNRITERYKNTISNWDWLDSGSSYYGFTGSGDTPDFVRDANWNITEKYLQLPGNILLTIHPSEQDANKQKTYSLPNIHGDVFATTNATGNLVGTTATGPFGEKIAGQTAPMNSVAGTAYGYVGQHEKLTETDFTVDLVQMGSRVYAPVLGRFIQVDPIEGGVDNNYVYPPDPVNDFDLEGTINWRKVGKYAAIGAGIAGAVACGASVVCGIAVGATAAAASYAATNAGTKSFSWKKMGVNAAVGGTLGAAGGIGQAAVKGFKIAQAAKAGNGNYSLGVANRTTSMIASKFFTAGSNGLRGYRGPAIKANGHLVSNFERFIVKPVSNRLQKYPNRVGNGHLRIKGWW